MQAALPSPDEALLEVWLLFGLLQNSQLPPGQSNYKFRDRAQGNTGKEKQVGCEDTVPLSQWLR